MPYPLFQVNVGNAGQLRLLCLPFFLQSRRRLLHLLDGLLQRPNLALQACLFCGKGSELLSGMLQFLICAWQYYFEQTNLELKWRQRGKGTTTLRQVLRLLMAGVAGNLELLMQLSPLLQQLIVLALQLEELMIEAGDRLLLLVQLLLERVAARRLQCMETPLCLKFACRLAKRSSKAVHLSAVLKLVLRLQSLHMHQRLVGCPLHRMLFS